MTFDELQDGEKIFIDANIFVYHFGELSGRKTEGLLTNDSLLITPMKQAGLSKLATNDDDFDNIAWLDIYKPSDV